MTSKAFKSKNQKILVLGGTGFVGKNFIKALKKTKYKVYSFSKSTGLDLTDLNAVRKVFKKIKPQAIVNLAAHTGSLHYVTKNAAMVLDDNLRMALNMYKAVAEFCPKAHIINPLSNCSYPGNVNVQFEKDWLMGDVHHSVVAYGNAKRFIYFLAKTYKMQHNINSVNFLLPNTFGPGDHTDPNKTHALNGMIIRMIKAKKDGQKEFEIWGTGKPIREWAYIDDVVNFLIKALTIKADLIYPVNIAQKKGYSIKESAEAIAKALNFKGKLVFNTKYQDGAPVKILDNTNFKKLFPNYEFYSHTKGIKNTVEYYNKVLNY